MQCACNEHPDPFKFNQDDHAYSGPEVEIIPQAGIGTNPIEVSIWEDDAYPCTGSSGRPPFVPVDHQHAFDNWGARPTVTVSLINGNTMVSFATLAVPMVLDPDSNPLTPQHDDEIGEARVPSCWRSSGGTYFGLYLSDANHPWNGNAQLDFRFGARDPICPPPSFYVSLDGPSSDSAYASVTVTATPHYYTSPVHYDWTIDGAPACSDATTCTGSIGPEGSYTTFAVEATDGAGSVASASHQVFAEYSGCPGCQHPATSAVVRPPSW